MLHRCCSISYVTESEAVRALKRWRANDDQRDPLVRAAVQAGIPKERIHRLTGIARTTINRILKEQESK